MVLQAPVPGDVQPVVTVPDVPFTYRVVGENCSSKAPASQFGTAVAGRGSSRSSTLTVHALGGTSAKAELPVEIASVSGPVDPLAASVRVPMSVELETESAPKSHDASLATLYSPSVTGGD